MQSDARTTFILVQMKTPGPMGSEGPKFHFSCKGGNLLRTLKLDFIIHVLVYGNHHCDINY